MGAHPTRRLRAGFVIGFVFGAGAVVLALGGCTTPDQDPAKTPIGSVVTGKTDTVPDYLQQVGQRNQEQPPTPFNGGKY